MTQGLKTPYFEATTLVSLASIVAITICVYHGEDVIENIIATLSSNSHPFELKYKQFALLSNTSQSSDSPVTSEAVLEDNSAASVTCQS